MKFIEYINERIKDGEEFDAIIGGVGMPATLGFCEDWIITDYCKEKFGELLNSEITIIPEDESYPECVEVHYDDYKMGEKFCWAVAGYIEEIEWDKLFREG